MSTSSCRRKKHSDDRDRSSRTTSTASSSSSSSSTTTTTTTMTSHTYRPPAGVVMGLRTSSGSSAVARNVPRPATWVDPAFLEACRDNEDDYIRHIMTSRRLTSEVVNYKDKTGKTGLSYICVNGNVSLLELISSIKCLDVNPSDNEGNTPLHFASQAGHIEVVRHLLDTFKTLEIDARNILGFTALMKASLQGRTKCVKLLLAAGASPVLRDHGRGLCSSEWARFCGRQTCAEVLEKFLKQGNYSPMTIRRRQLKELEKCNSEPNLQLLLTNSEPKDRGWFKQKLKRAFTRTSTSSAAAAGAVTSATATSPATTTACENGGGQRTTIVEYSLVRNLSNVALCASSPLVPTAKVSRSMSQHGTHRRGHTENGSVVIGDCRESAGKTLVPPKVQVTEVTCNRTTSTETTKVATPSTRSSQAYRAAYKASKAEATSR